MAFNPNAQVEHYISISVEPEPKIVEFPAKRTEATVARSQAPSEFEQMAALMRNDITDFVAEGRDIRAEVEGLIIWRRQMGERSGSSTWGPVQETYAERWIKFQRERLSKLKSAVEAGSKNASEIIEYIFSAKNRGQFDEAVTEQARQELGLYEREPTQ
jgi:hypothetical protein